MAVEEAWEQGSQLVQEVSLASREEARYPQLLGAQHLDVRGASKAVEARQVVVAGRSLPALVFVAGNGRAASERDCILLLVWPLGDLARKVVRSRHK